jgi:chromosome segregation ATPase
MAEEKKIVAFKVVVDTDDLDRSATAAAERVEMLKQKQKELDKSTDSGRIAYQKYNAEIKKAQGDLRKFTELQKKQIVVNETLEGSNEQLRAQLSLVTAQYNSLSKEQRENTEKGKKYKEQVSELTATLKENEKAVGDNRRNVGNYEEALRNAGVELQKTTAFTDKNRKSNLQLQGQMEASARSAAAIAGTFALLSNVIGENEKAQDALRKITLSCNGCDCII